MTGAALAPDVPPDGVDAIDLPDGRRVEGLVEAGYGRLMDAFVANFRDRREVGAACAVWVEGQPVLDVWGGLADSRSGRAWTHDTAAVTFSCTKGILAICVYDLVQAGLLELDAPIASVWPSFGAAGKASISLRQAMAHRSGLPALDTDLTLADIFAWEPVIRAIERQPPLYPPGVGHVYHAMTYGWIVGEVIRRVTGRSPGRWFLEAIADRLALRTWIGLPEGARPTVAWMEPPLPDDDSEEARAAARIARENRIVDRAGTMGGAFAFPAADGRVTFNDPAIQAAEIPGANGISTAPSLARLYAACVSPLAGPPLLTEDSLSDALRVQSAGPQLSGMPDDGARWGTGFQLSSPPVQPMLGETSFGHAGAGGQLAFGDAAHRVGFAYLANQMGGYGDVRARELTVALRASLGA